VAADPQHACLLRPPTLETINHVIVAAGHAFAPEAITAVRELPPKTRSKKNARDRIDADRGVPGKVLTLVATIAQVHGLSG
jgi:hypothetical protein